MIRDPRHLYPDEVALVVICAVGIGFALGAAFAALWVLG